MLASGDFTFTPAANANGLTSFTYRLLDGRGGVVTGTVEILITSVNDAPQGTDKGISLTRSPNAAAVDMIFSEDDFGFTDTLDTPANTLAGVKIASLPARGTLSLSGIPVTLNTVVPASSIQSGLLKYAPATNGFGANYSNFDFQVIDNGGNDNLGVDMDSSTNKLMFNISSTDVSGPSVSIQFESMLLVVHWNDRFRDWVDTGFSGAANARRLHCQRRELRPSWYRGSMSTKSLFSSQKT